MKYTDSTVSADFIDEVARQENELSLARAGLLFAKACYPDISCSWYLRQLDLVADEIAKKIDHNSDARTKLSATSDYVFRELGYQGNTEDYYDPKNSFLNEVIERRVGIPISLSVIFLEIADRVGLVAKGVAFPGHFLIKVDDETTFTEPQIIDAFDGGACLGQDMFVARFRQRMQKPMSATVVAQMLAPAAKRDILIRQLRNLLAIFSKQGSAENSLIVVNHILHLVPDSSYELVQRGKLFREMGYQDAAIVDFERALANCDEPTFAEQLMNAIRQAKLEGKSVH
ncbi:MAG: transglutaminase family protein [Pseudomonadota bacterium]